MNDRNVDSKSREYIRGYNAFRNGMTDNANPYPQGDLRRLAWYDGYFDARTEHNIGRQLERFGHKWR